MKQAIGYIRVSTEKQANEGVSLEAQQARIESWCKANGYELVNTHKDAGVSGALSVADRDGMIQSGMETGVREGYERLDDILEAM